MKVFLVVGKKRAGKTTLTVDLIKKLGAKVNLIYDVNNEYTRKFGIKNDYQGPIDRDRFLGYCDPDNPQAVKNATIVCEEATSYLSTKGREEHLVKIISRSRHNNNAVIIIFHSMADVPRYIYSLCDYIALFKTNEFSSALDARMRKNNQFMKYYDLVKIHPDPHKFVFFENLG